MEKVYSMIYRDCWRGRWKVFVFVPHTAPRILRRPYIVNMAKLERFLQSTSPEYLQVGGSMGCISD